jgi:hypothetical protein
LCIETGALLVYHADVGVYKCSDYTVSLVFAAA